MLKVFKPYMQNGATLNVNTFSTNLIELIQDLNTYGYIL